MSVTIVRYTTKPERADENQALIERVFAELAAAAPDGLRYASFRLADGVSFVHVASVETDDGANPLSSDRRPSPSSWPRSATAPSSRRPRPTRP